jgi:AcrR family transcriptional regulator
MDKESQKLSAREKILSSAEKLFIQKGYTNTSVRDVCKEAKVNIALINYYFNSKEELYKEIIRLKTDPIIKALKELSEDEEISARDKFFKLFDIYSNFYEQNCHLPQLIAREVVTNSEISKWFHTHIIAKELKYIKDIFSEAQKYGIINNKYDSVVIMSFCLGAMMFILAGSQMVEKLLGSEFTIKGSITEKIEIIKELLLNGVSNK